MEKRAFSRLRDFVWPSIGAALTASVLSGCGRDPVGPPLAVQDAGYPDTGYTDIERMDPPDADDGVDGVADSGTIRLLPASSPPLPIGAVLRWRGFAIIGAIRKDLAFDPLATWSIDDPRIARVAPRTSEVRGLAPGETRLRVRHPTLATAVAKVSVTEARLLRIETDPPPIQLGLGETRQLRAMGVYSDATRVEVTQAAQWSSSDVRIVRVGDGLEDPGRIYAGSTGRTTVRVWFAGLENEAHITVGTPATGPKVLPERQVVPVTGIATFILTAQNVGPGQDLSAQAMWSSDQPSQVVSLGGGAFLCQTAAVATITASLEGIPYPATLRCGILP